MNAISIVIWLLFFLYSDNVYSQNWISLNNPLNAEVRSFCNDSVNNRLIIGGSFYYQINGSFQEGVASWNGVQLDSVSTFPCWPVRVLFNFNNEIYANGCSSNIVKFSNGIWQPTNSNLSGYANCFFTYDGELYAGGGFDSINGTQSSGLAKWDGSQWVDIDLLVDGQVYAMAEYQNDLYLGGFFRDSNFVVHHICYLHQGQWYFLPDDIIENSWQAINTMVVFNNELYVGGFFSQSNGNLSNSIQRWNGSIWRDLQNGVSKFNGSSGEVLSMLEYQNMLFVVGDFDNANTINANNIAMWNGHRWCSLGNLFDNTIYSICEYNDSLFVGGSFQYIDGNQIAYISKLTNNFNIDTCDIFASIYEQTPETFIRLFPNPTTGEFTLEINNTKSKNINFRIFSFLGQEVKEYSLAPNGNSFRGNLSDVASGIYFLTLNIDGVQSTYKIIKE